MEALPAASTARMYRTLGPAVGGLGVCDGGRGGDGGAGGTALGEVVVGAVERVLEADGVGGTGVAQ